MTVIISGYMELIDPSQMEEMLTTARPHIQGALDEEGCIAYSWTKDFMVEGRLQIYEEWTTSEALEAHLQSHWYRDMGAHLANFERKPMTNVIKKYRVDLEEPVYDDTGVARGHFFTEGK
jgi:quinol monooxygenase YgiN